MNDEAVYRTAPATPGLLIMTVKMTRKWRRTDLSSRPVLKTTVAAMRGPDHVLEFMERAICAV